MAPQNEPQPSRSMSPAAASTARGSSPSGAGTPERGNPATAKGAKPGTAPGGSVPRAEQAQGQRPGSGDGPFLSDVKTLRERARKHIEEGAVTAGYGADREKVIELLNDALATEIVCVLRYKRHYYMATGIHAQSVQAEFLQHANEEQAHADQIAARIVQLGGEPNFSPEGLSSRSHSEYVEGTTLLDMIREDLVAERVAIDSYAEMIRFLGTNDPTTRRMLEGILAMEEEHADDLAALLEKVGGN
jgi:bacterioferritin